MACDAAAYLDQAPLYSQLNFSQSVAHPDIPWCVFHLFGGKLKFKVSVLIADSNLTRFRIQFFARMPICVKSIRPNALPKGNRGSGNRFFAVQSDSREFHHAVGIIVGSR